MLPSVAKAMEDLAPDRGIEGLGYLLFFVFRLGMRRVLFERFFGGPQRASLNMRWWRDVPGPHRPGAHEKAVAVPIQLAYTLNTCSKELLSTTNMQEVRHQMNQSASIGGPLVLVATLSFAVACIPDRAKSGDISEHDGLYLEGRGE